MLVACKTTESPAVSEHIVYYENDVAVGHAYLILYRNSLHAEPVGLLEDLQVYEGHRGNGIEESLMEKVIHEARLYGCYKLIAMNRLEGGREHLHQWYEQVGFTPHGVEYRMNF